MENLDINQIAITIADEVSSAVDVKIALIAAGGVAIGALIQVLGNFIHYHLQNNSKKKLDNERKKYLRLMLEKEEYKWRKISTLSAVIGTSDDETKRLLIEIGARGSENGNGSWGLISRNAFPDTE